jgi:hypothetical protein
MRVTLGAAFLVAVDIRKGSPTLGKWVGVEASAENRRQVWAPAGFARGFCVLSDTAEIQYKCTGIYSNKAESGISMERSGDRHSMADSRPRKRNCPRKTRRRRPSPNGWPPPSPNTSGISLKN